MSLVKRRFFLIAATLVAMGATFLSARIYLAERLATGKSVHATVLDVARPLPEFSLLDHRGAQFTRDSLSGGWTMMFFGFTNCPDICSTTLFALATVRSRLESLGLDEPPTVAFVTVDPMRDGVMEIAHYLQRFESSFVGVTGELAALQPLYASLGVGSRYVREEDSVDYSVQHGAALFLIDPDGELRALFGPPHEPEQIATDIKAILERFGEKT